MEIGTMLCEPAVPPTRDRVRQNTPSRLNSKLDQAAMERIWFYANQSKEVITQQIQTLDREWDIERAMEMSLATASLLGIFLSVARRRRWLAIPAFAMTGLLYHSTFGSAQAVYIFRCMGFRTRREIDAEKYALRMLRGDFDAIKTASESTHRAIEALRLSRL